MCMFEQGFKVSRGIPDPIMVGAVEHKNDEGDTTNEKA